MQSKIINHNIILAFSSSKEQLIICITKLIKLLDFSNPPENKTD